MPALEWKTDYELGLVAMDDTHREFALLLNRLDESTPETSLDLLDELLRHTVAHFAQEDVWMEESDFPPLYCHRGEHERVLEVLRQVRSMAAAGDAAIVRTLVREFPLWFANHAVTMDAMLAEHIGREGYTAHRIAVEATLG